MHVSRILEPHYSRRYDESSNITRMNLSTMNTSNYKCGQMFTQPQVDVIAQAP